MPLQERLLVLAHMRLHEARPREASAHLEQAHLRRHPSDHGQRLAPVDLGLRARLRAQRDEHLVDQLAQLRSALAHIPADLPLGHLHAMLVPESFVDPLRRVPLLARRRPISIKPRIDQRPPLTQLRRQPPLRPLPRRRQQRLQRLPDRPAMHAVPSASACDRQPLELAVPADLLEQLHSRSHPFRGLPSTLDRATKVDPPSDGSGAKSSVRTGAKSGVRGQRIRSTATGAAHAVTPHVRALASTPTPQTG